MSTQPDLDAEELKFLAMQASRQNLGDQALLYLKRAIQRAPERGDLYYLMAAEHAQLGMHERAMEEMERALDLSAELHTARLQLALLYLGAQRAEDARRVLQPLQDLAPDHALHHFGLGLQYLMQDRFAECRAALEQGIALNVENPPLNTDMGQLLDALPAPDAGQAPPGGSVWLSAYRRDAGPD